MTPTISAFSSCPPQSAHEAAVDLERVDLEAGQVAEGRVAGAEVVEVDLHAEGAELGQGRHRRLGVLHHRPLGDLEAQAPRREPRLLEHRAHLIHQVVLPELSRRDVHVHGEGRLAGA